MDNRLKEMNDYILMIEKKSSDLIKKYQKTNQDLNSAIQKIGELTNKLETVSYTHLTLPTKA